jgi:hypothetical protein
MKGASLLSGVLYFCEEVASRKTMSERLTNSNTLHRNSAGKLPNSSLLASMVLVGLLLVRRANHR